MASAVPRARRFGTPAARALTRALAAVARGRLSPAERAWGARIEAWRAELAARPDPTGVPAFPGEGGPRDSGYRVTEPRVALGVASRFMSLPPDWCRLLARLTIELRPASSLELGTGFGISGAYLAAGNSLTGAGGLLTLEGAPQWAATAAEGFERLELDAHAGLLVGRIEDNLEVAISRAAPFDLVFVDAEHRERETVEHLERLMPHLSRGAMVVLDDVDWPDVAAAFERISRLPGIALAVRSGRLGFLSVERSSIEGPR